MCLELFFSPKPTSAKKDLLRQLEKAFQNLRRFWVTFFLLPRKNVFRFRIDSFSSWRRSKSCLFLLWIFADRPTKRMRKRKSLYRRHLNSFFFCKRTFDLKVTEEKTFLYTLSNYFWQTTECEKCDFFHLRKSQTSINLCLFNFLSQISKSQESVRKKSLEFLFLVGVVIIFTVLKKVFGCGHVAQNYEKRLSWPK